MVNYNAPINYNATIPYNGVAGANSSSGVRRLALSNLQGHPQIAWDNYQKKKEKNEEKMLLALLEKMMDEYFD